MTCVKTAELIEMQFGMLSQVWPGNMYYMGLDAPLFGVSGQLKSIVNHRILRTE